jgi:hypothetical protein
MKDDVNRIGFWAGLAAFVSTLAYVVVQLLQMQHLLTFPTDGILIYGTSLCIVIPFVLEMLALHYITKHAKRIWSHAAVIFSIMYAVFVTANYVVQLATVIPMNLKGRLSEVRILDQSPHSLFWDFDALGYIFMGLGMLIALPAFGNGAGEKWAKRMFLANALMTPLIAVVYFAPVFSEKLLLLGAAWGITAPAAMICLALVFKKRTQSVTAANNHSRRGVHRPGTAQTER